MDNISNDLTSSAALILEDLDLSESDPDENTTNAYTPYDSYDGWSEPWGWYEPWDDGWYETWDDGDGWYEPWDPYPYFEYIPYLEDLVESVSTPILPDHDPGWNFTTAYDLGTIDGSLTIQDLVNGSDQADLYQFSLNRSGEYTFTLDELGADVDMNLYSSYGELLDSSFNIGTISESINISLDSGDYFAEVTSYDLMDSNYELTIAEDNSIV